MGLKRPRILVFSFVFVLTIFGCDFVSDIVQSETATTPPQVALLTSVPGHTPGVNDNPGSIDTETLETLRNTIVPINDPADLAKRLKGILSIPLPPDTPQKVHRVGASDTFFVKDVDTAGTFTVDASLRFITPHVYFWIEDGVDFDQEALRKLSQAFENKIYPTNREFFGEEWSPGIDGDEHIYILLARGIGSGIAGYFSSVDSLNPLAHPDSNAHEMFVLSADNLNLRQEFTYAVLAHEFQHMIHWNLDRNETSWINEGFSEVAVLLNGYSLKGADFYFALNPDIQLNDWPEENRSPHYGASFLFLTYFLDRLGEAATQALVAHPADGFAGIDAVLHDFDIPNSVTNLATTANDLFVDWALANYLNDSTVADGRYTYNNYHALPQFDATETISDCSSGIHARDVHQYGVDYISLQCDQAVTLHFDGADGTTLLPANPYSGEYAFWSNHGDTSDMTLTRSFDFSAHSGPLTLNYWTWYDIEKDWDYVYVMASVDGENWEILTTPSGTDTNPSGNSYGWGYTGFSGGSSTWIQESVDLSKYAGESILLRFEYITDAAINREGLMLDDIAIPEIGYFSDFEQDNDGWQADGFVRIKNLLPQTFRLAVILYGDTTTVQYIDVQAGNIADIHIDFGNGVDEAVLIVTGTTRFTRQLAVYSFDFLP